MITDGTIYLRAPEPGDLPAMYAVENDSSTWQSSAVRAPMSMRRLEQFVESYNPDIIGAESGRFTICRRDDDEVLGFIDFFELDAVNRRAGIGIVILSGYRSRGYATAALRILAGYMRCEQGLHSLWAVVTIDNEASRRAFISAGFTGCGRLRSWIRRDCSYTDAIMLQRVLTP